MSLRRPGKHAPDQTRSRLRFVLRKQLVPEVRRPLRLEPLMPGRRFGDIEEQLVDVPCEGRRYRRASSVSLLAICHTSASAVLGEVTPASRRRTPRSVPRTVEQVTNSLTTIQSETERAPARMIRSEVASMFRAQGHRDSGAAPEPIPTPPRSRETQPPRGYSFSHERT